LLLRLLEMVLEPLAVVVLGHSVLTVPKPMHPPKPMHAAVPPMSTNGTH